MGSGTPPCQETDRLAGRTAESGQGSCLPGFPLSKSRRVKGQTTVHRELRKRLTRTTGEREPCSGHAAMRGVPYVMHSQLRATADWVLGFGCERQNGAAHIPTGSKRECRWVQAGTNR